MAAAAIQSHGVVTPRAGVWIETPTSCESRRDLAAVTPRAGVWIETTKSCRLSMFSGVTPRAGGWIETRPRAVAAAADFRSLPVRECGLKPHVRALPHVRAPVTPRAGVGIETLRRCRSATSATVTPRAGVWIETCSRIS